MRNLTELVAGADGSNVEVVTLPEIAATEDVQLALDEVLLGVAEIDGHTTDSRGRSLPTNL